MSTFASSFWTPDHAAGLGVLFSKLQQGVQENLQLLTVARLRADAEDLYSQKLAEIESVANRIDGGFQKDDGASVKKAYDGVRLEMQEASRAHRRIAGSVRELVVSPFARWCEAHAARVQNSQDDLQGRIRQHDRQAETVRSYRSAYYNKCRRVEDLDEEEKLAFQDPQSQVAQSSPASNPQSVPSITVEEDDEPEPIDIGDVTYTPGKLREVLSHALENIAVKNVKVPILGTYPNVSSGADVTEYIQKHMNGTSVAYAERIGQDLVGNGFLRLIGNVGNTFANSSKMNYQWRPKAFRLTGIPEKKPKMAGRSSTLMSNDSVSAPDGLAAGVVSDYLGGWNPLNNAHPNETPAEKLRREAREADERYKAAVKKLDGLRCTLEEAMVDHLKFMERCELNRLEAIKAVILDFSGTISNVIPSLQSTVDKMMLFQETVQPPGDLRYFLENYRTGGYAPKVQIYENYYNSVDDQTFGVDIEARARSDRKRVPLIVTTILTFLDNHYPDLEGDEARRSIWLVDVPLAATHHLRNQINNGRVILHELLDKYEVPIVASVLKLYLLELPDSLVSSHVYEIVKTIYATTAQSASEQARVQVVQSTLGQLRLANIATLDALTTHFTRLIELTSADEAYISSLASTLAPCILRPKVDTGMSMTERYNVKLVRDLFAHKDAIFGELKRASTLSHTNSDTTRQARAISTDESRRREHMEERARLIAHAREHQAQAGGADRRGRAPSPTPTSRTPISDHIPHKRDTSRTRFPVHASGTPTTSPTERRVISPTERRPIRDSLEVPSSPPSQVSQPEGPHSPPRANGTLHQPPPPISALPHPFASREQRHAAHDMITGRDSRVRSATSGSEAKPAAMSASINGPLDFMEPSHYYSTSVDSKAGSAPAPGSFPSSSAPTSIGSAPSSATTATSRYNLTNPDPRASSFAPSTSSKADGPAKSNSLNRTTARSGAFVRKQAAVGLQRQSLVGRRESTDQGDYMQSPVESNSGSNSTGEDASSHKGVDLVDKPMDFD